MHGLIGVSQYPWQPLGLEAAWIKLKVQELRDLPGGSAQVINACEEDIEVPRDLHTTEVKIVIRAARPRSQRPDWLGGWGLGFSEFGDPTTCAEGPRFASSLIYWQSCCAAAKPLRQVLIQQVLKSAHGVMGRVSWEEDVSS